MKNKAAEINSGAQSWHKFLTRKHRLWQSWHKFLTRKQRLWKSIEYGLFVYVLVLMSDYGGKLWWETEVENRGD